MTGKKIDMAEAGKAVAVNVKRLRTEARMTYVEVSQKVLAEGRKIPVLGLSHIEDETRRVDVDDLVALATVLGTTPLDLMGLRAKSPSRSVKAPELDGVWMVFNSDGSMACPFTTEIEALRCAVGLVGAQVEFTKFGEAVGRPGSE